ncbi:hypothetical protein FIM10_18630 [Sphingomonadales bacterium 56]|uniref:Uncharacterized protein n=1 Tax=Sphingobium indicum TaxID=332055 RepID=A0A4Q4IT19_9SPHN|nr:MULTISPECIES: hypothetical protein [Sphingobium]MBY2930699.1 hypothetical protein [Sphingomonadales bacterium 56]MBY2960759.1 hypothetical protein [Sphingomonadales bacterium 58]NYI25035.1 hypothetical protein [Sphingobium indicum]RYL96464.1 hypothetical protein EWH08_19800 [Sphingobium indicum]CAD7341780.1 hypothetical protein SPHS6_03751 [Sphingobium sp. S6]
MARRPWDPSEEEAARHAALAERIFRGSLFYALAIIGFSLEILYATRTGTRGRTLLQGLILIAGGGFGSLQILRHFGLYRSLVHAHGPGATCARLRWSLALNAVTVLIWLAMIVVVLVRAAYR